MNRTFVTKFEKDASQEDLQIAFDTHNETVDQFTEDCLELDVGAQSTRTFLETAVVDTVQIHHRIFDTASKQWAVMPIPRTLFDKKFNDLYENRERASAQRGIV